ncbi:MAG TPA: hypothetical protein VH678_06190 [Xanthobacteraceae bacterium]|jgi:hypothetical protein
MPARYEEIHREHTAVVVRKSERSKKVFGPALADGEAMAGEMAREMAADPPARADGSALAYDATAAQN